MEKSDILSAFQFRHACKTFDPNKKISHEDFNFILETAHFSPSSFGFEPWHFIVVQDKALKEKLKEVAWGAPQKLDTASHFVIGLTIKPPYTRYNSRYIQNFMEQVQNLPPEVIQTKTNMLKGFQENDFDLNNDRHMFDWASKQCYIPLANMMTSAAMIGIDSCPMEGFKQQKTNTVLKQDFDIDTNFYGVSYMVAFGYRVNNPPTKTRRKLEKVVTWK